MIDLINIDNLTDKIWTLWSEYYKYGDKTSQEILDISKADILKFAEQQANGATTEEKQCNLPVVSSMLPDTEEGLKKICCAFFRYWWNAAGNNTEQGFDKWLNEQKKNND